MEYFPRDTILKIDINQEKNLFQKNATIYFVLKVYNTYLCIVKTIKQNIMKKNFSGNITLTSKEFIDLYGFISYLLTLPRVPYEEYMSVDNVMLSEHDIELFTKLEKFGDNAFSKVTLNNL